MIARVLVFGFQLVALSWLAIAAQAQEQGVPVSAILTIDSDRLFADSQFGRRVVQELDAEQSILRAENRQMEAQLAEEERVLTAKRKEMASEDFSAVAEAFDARVQEIREFQDNKAIEIAQQREVEEAAFVQAARPVLENLMREARASVILERRTIFLSITAIDITDLAISRLDAAIGEGTTNKIDPE
ncbi:OmpH family outer membrane protein [Shimia abyssi]|uniref:Periplasmic chaperone for outer membrane proteins Skp n=1 Tax=Shimia abyssi TaxID=1662395 RepID=A0A2P8F6S1_9RHOB|nr:OmpH family outer membrane protein [Shimia abyssi]PSL17398.1 periplasmic chaperone for outer membrane proteins Skp [Shimia abyssi]